jgi:hypothetical protein
VFDLLGITLLHGWLVDPQDTEAARCLGTKSYNQLVELLVAGLEQQQQNVVAPQASTTPQTHPSHTAAASASASCQEGTTAQQQQQLLPPRPSLQPQLASAPPQAPVHDHDLLGDDVLEDLATVVQSPAAHITDVTVSQVTSITQGPEQLPDPFAASGSTSSLAVAAATAAAATEPATQEPGNTALGAQTSVDDMFSGLDLNDMASASLDPAPVTAAAYSLQATATPPPPLPTPQPAGPTLLPGNATHVRDAHVAKSFLDANASQLTVYGISAIEGVMPENSLAVFFRYMCKHTQILIHSLSFSQPVCTQDLHMGSVMQLSLVKWRVREWL